MALEDIKVSESEKRLWKEKVEKISEETIKEL